MGNIGPLAGLSYIERRIIIFLCKDQATVCGYEQRYNRGFMVTYTCQHTQEDYNLLICRL